MADKISKAAVLYIINADKHYYCKECCFFIPRENVCTYFKQQEWVVDPLGSCNRWTTNENGFVQGPGTQTKEDSGYVVNRPGYSCGRCEYFGADQKRCQKVDEKKGPTPGIIHPRACCNAWSPDKIRGRMGEAELRSMKLYK